MIDPDADKVTNKITTLKRIVGHSAQVMRSGVIVCLVSDDNLNTRLAKKIAVFTPTNNTLTIILQCADFYSD